ncbi:hypothetical protein LQZ19_05360 [Treponema primitia]|uniref:hypothetical protein n=1 Tax=Treponema primitia TaxID=88058 RepID=UPI0039812FC9
MIMEKTIEIPAHPKDESLRLELEIPPEVPAGKATFRLEWVDAHPKSKKELAAEAIEALCGLYTSDGHAVDRFLAWSHEEKLREFEIEEHQWGIRSG